MNLAAEERPHSRIRFLDDTHQLLLELAIVDLDPVYLSGLLQKAH